jgi:hypothetical protein
MAPLVFSWCLASKFVGGGLNPRPFNRLGNGGALGALQGEGISQ